MALRLEGSRGIVEGSVGVEEAETLLSFFQEDGTRTLDLSGCTHLHTAALQVILALRPTIERGPDDPFLRHFVFPLLTGRPDVCRQGEEP